MSEKISLDSSEVHTIFLCSCCKDKRQISACQTDNFYLCIERFYI